jgi:hypothetical protein
MVKFIIVSTIVSSCLPTCERDQHGGWDSVRAREDVEADGGGKKARKKMHGLKATDG